MFGAGVPRSALILKTPTRHAASLSAARAGVSRHGRMILTKPSQFDTRLVAIGELDAAGLKGGYFGRLARPNPFGISVNERLRASFVRVVCPEYSVCLSIAR
jgi:hypothetical protein